MCQQKYYLPVVACDTTDGFERYVDGVLRP